MDAIKEAREWMGIHGGVPPISLSTQIIGGLISEVDRLKMENDAIGLRLNKYLKTIKAQKASLNSARAEVAEEAAEVAESHALRVRSANTYRGKVNQMADEAAGWMDGIAADIRAKVAQPKK